MSGVVGFVLIANGVGIAEVKMTFNVFVIEIASFFWSNVMFVDNFSDSAPIPETISP